MDRGAAHSADEGHARTALLMACGALAIGTAAAVYYAWAGLTLSHYDARAHLVVARRIIDSITPGWQQIGAVWLPLPHVLNMVPVQVDALYRTGASAVAISVISTAVTAWGLASWILRTTGSRSGAFAAVALVVGNPNLLYLQSTPMTEPLLLATTAAAVALVAAWVDTSARRWPVSAGIALAAACLTRYEAWPVAAAVVAIAGAVLLRRGARVRDVLRACGRLAAWPVSAIVLFLINSRWTVGAWFISGGFFVPENTDALGHPLVAWAQVREGLYDLSGSALIWPAYAGAALVLYTFVGAPPRAAGAGGGGGGPAAAATGLTRGQSRPIPAPVDAAYAATSGTSYRTRKGWPCRYAYQGSAAAPASASPSATDPRGRERTNV